ncbi:hypothetical protein AB664_07185 [Brucella anthropi]|uniref:Uncharacterized protein n=1 Tax=Brucella anthropi TaxID=529 RepID=A0A656Z4F9_BRUAN|nr:hypothetical protein AB664_07185 [Brucella anthropi]
MATRRIALFMGWLLLVIPRLHLGWVGGLIVSVKVRIGPWIFLFDHFHFLLFVSGVIECLKQHGCNNLDARAVSTSSQPALTAEAIKPFTSLATAFRQSVSRSG